MVVEIRTDSRFVIIRELVVIPGIPGTKPIEAVTSASVYSREILNKSYGPGLTGEQRQKLVRQALVYRI